ncbi:hypothetical protein GCM10010277_80850 [Streptomyces longisporoflavus]|nr:hypothetical protein GCM10010277_80850 [Streptomyces longisporoflavus]
MDTGKSRLLIALGSEAVRNGFRARYVLATELVNELVEAVDEKQLTKTIARYGHVDLCALVSSATRNSAAVERSCCSRG